ATSKKHFLLKCAEELARLTGQDEHEIFDKLNERENLGSTGMGDGVAIPHARLKNLDRVYSLFISMDQGLDFDSVDDKPIDLAFVLLAPQDAGADHLQALAKISRMLRHKEFCARLRGANSQDAVLSLLLHPEDLIAA
ncbi:MAG TPA: PTS sugar transporter subunit IIA, partial [Alphaproteobacteria bacterium]